MAVEVQNEVNLAMFNLTITKMTIQFLFASAAVYWSFNLAVVE